MRLELTVVTENRAAVALYKKDGFLIEGVKKHSLMIDGKAFDEYYMVKILLGFFHNKKRLALEPPSAFCCAACRGKVRNNAVGARNNAAMCQFNAAEQ